MLEDLEDVLVRADLGVTAATRIAALVGKGRYDKQIAPEDVRAILAEEVERVLTPVAKPLDVGSAKSPSSSWSSASMAPARPRPSAS